jgi:trk system potassium uptake protein TrkH
VVSAFGTVGLSAGITAALSPFGKLVIIGTMFFGRIGPLTIITAMAQQGRGHLIKYPTGDIRLG